MASTFFFGSFMASGIPMALFLANTDSEPDMAGLSLLLFCFVGALASLLAYNACFHKFCRAPGALNGLCTGAIAASSFFGVLSLISKDFDLWPCLFLALVLSTSIAATSAFFSTKKHA